MPYCDSHAHLADPRFDADRAEVLARAAEAGVTRVVTCGADLATSAAEADLVAWAARRGTSPALYAAVGIHAHEARSAVGPGGALDEGAFQRLVALAGRPGVVALGEIGLDYHYTFSPPEVQRAVLGRQLEIARDLGLPVILHNRESDADLVAQIEAGPAGLSGVLHCFLGDRRLAEWALARGLYLGVAGPITFRNPGALPDVLRSVPLDRLLVETDSPYLAPHPHRGRRNEPAHVVHVAEGLAEVLGLPPERVAEETAANARRLFGIP